MSEMEFRINQVKTRSSTQKQVLNVPNQNLNFKISKSKFKLQVQTYQIKTSKDSKELVERGAKKRAENSVV